MEKKRPKIAVRVKEVPEQTYDAEGNFVIPGLIDCHVHFREPGLSHKEDWRSEKQGMLLLQRFI